MGKSCIGCGKAMGGMLGAYGVKLLYGEVCLTCNKKLSRIPSHEFLTPTQIKDVISGRVQPGDVRVATEFVHPGGGGTQTKQMSPAEEIRQYKELLDEGVITQEEFDTVKKRLMQI
ncbi:MAG: SHOCT domain-containing protein [Methanomassiliicoccaceae archaeon]|nr:SHOCT domain-containing protein [Methanomassiliicoccaceae archaeon]